MPDDSSVNNKKISGAYPEQTDRQRDERQIPRRPTLRPGIIISFPYARVAGDT